MTVPLVLQVLLVMVGAGLLGGFAGHRARLTVQPPRGETDQLPPATSQVSGHANGELLTDLVVGIVAALCVPIFLAVAQSELLKNIAKGGDPSNWDLLSLAAYCLIASFSSRAFMETLSGQVLHQTRVDQQRLKEGQQTLRDEVADLSEEKGAPEKLALTVPTLPTTKAPTKDDTGLAEPPMQPTLDPSISAGLSDVARKVISALNSEAYTRRSLSGTAKAAGLTKPEANLALARLEQAGLVSHGQSARTGSLMYQLTPNGRLAAVP